MIKVGDVWRKSDLGWGSDIDTLVIITKVTSLYIRYRYTSGGQYVHIDGGPFTHDDFLKYFTEVTYD